VRMKSQKREPLLPARGGVAFCLIAGGGMVIAGILWVGTSFSLLGALLVLAGLVLLLYPKKRP
jgi:hypothetical protein